MAKVKIKSVAFNLEDPFESKLYSHTQKFSVFSAYMKRLVQRDCENIGATPKQQEITLETNLEGFI